MAKEAGLGQQFYIAGYDLSNDVGRINNCGSPRTALLATGIDKSALERIYGQSNGILDFTTFFNDAALQQHAALKGLPTADVIAIYATGVAVDDSAVGMVAKQNNFDGVRDEQGNFEFNVLLENNGRAMEWGNMLSAGKITHASATSSASRDDSASSSAGAAAYLQIFDIDSGTPTVVVEDSANNSTWATLISFTAVADGNEPASERKTVSGTVDRYLRLTTTGTFTNCDFAVLVRRGESVDVEGY